MLNAKNWLRHSAMTTLMSSVIACACYADAALADTSTLRAPGPIVSHSLPAPVTGAAAGETAATKVTMPLQAWQIRRNELAKTLVGVKAGDTNANLEFNAVLSEFENQVMARTPMENMDILGVFYVPKDGLVASLPIIVQNAVLGWYDALRFGTASGRADIINRESFFKRALILAGPEEAAKAIKQLQSDPAAIDAQVKLGVSLAEKFRYTDSYDRQWPTAYGFERIACTLSKGPCVLPDLLPADEWDQAWAKAKQVVIDYYTPPKPEAAAPAANSTTTPH